MASKKKTYKPVVPDTSGGSLADYKFNATVNNRRPQTSINTQNTAKAKGPKPLTKTEQWFKENPIPPSMSIVDELKYMADPGNITGANQIVAAIKGEGMSTTERITTGLTGIVSGLAFAAGGKPSNPKTVLIHGGPAKLEGGVINPAKTATTPKYQHQGTTTSKLNDINLENIQTRIIPQAQKNLASLRKDIKTPGTFPNLNKGKTRGQISASKAAIASQEKWLKAAKKDNYFTAVSQAEEAYGSVGAYHVVTPKPSQVNTSNLTPGEYQVIGTQKPVKTFPAGKTTEETFAVTKQVNDYVAMLKKPKRTIAPVIAASQPKPPKKK